METSTLFPRRLEKHKFLLRSIEGVAFLTRDIGNYPCLTEASTADHYSTTRLQYSVVKIFKNLYKLVVRRLQVHEIHPAYELTQLHLLDGPLKYFEWSAAIKTLCNYITDHLELLLEHILNTDPNEMWQEKYDQSVELFSRMCKALENFVSLKHPQTCVKCKYDKNTCIWTHLRRLRHAYHLKHYILYTVSSTSSTWNKKRKIFILYIFI